MPDDVGRELALEAAERQLKLVLRELDAMRSLRRKRRWPLMERIAIAIAYIRLAQGLDR